MQYPEHQLDGASSSKYSCPVRSQSGHYTGPVAKYELPPRQLPQLPQPPVPVLRLGLMDTIDDFITSESGNSLLLCVFSILLVFPGSACLLVIGAAFTLDYGLRRRHVWVGPCAIVMLVLGAVLLVTACGIFASVCRSYRRARRRRQLAAAEEEASTTAAGGPLVAGSVGGSPYTCIVQV